MANLSRKNGVFVARFRLRRKEYQKSLRTRDRKAADLGLAQVELAIHRLALGLIAVPAGVDPGDFVVSGGTLAAPTADRDPPAAAPTLAAAVAEYRGNLAHLAETTRGTVGVHLGNLLKGLGAAGGRPVDAVTRRHLDDFLQARLRERTGDTVAKERATLLAFFGWCARRGYVAAAPTDGMVAVKKGGNGSKFQALAQVEATLARGGLAPAAAAALWDWLYLSPAEIAGLLALVKSRARREVSHVLHAVPAYTGMRRGEVLRLTWDDVEFDRDAVVARSRKQSRQEAETARRIDLHPELKAILLDWRAKRPRGQFVACDEGVLGPLARHQAVERFGQPLRGTPWAIPGCGDRLKVGFHTLRHSFASNLAAAGVDARVIDEFMGHQTVAMRKRYSHCFPSARRSAIATFSLAAPAAPATVSECEVVAGGGERGRR